MKLYVKHCPLACPERRPVLEQHLKDRGFTDVTWITGYPVNHPFVQWLHVRLGKYLSPSCISGLVKNLESCKALVDDPSVESALFCDDDAVFIKDWASKMHIPEGIPFVNVSVGVQFHVMPNGNIQQINNNGGCEVIWMTKDFARFVIQNVDARSGIDHVYFAIVRFLGFPLLCSPIAQQTSLLEPKKSSLEHGEKYQPPESWFDFVSNFKPTGLDYIQLWNESGIAREDD
jgi:hypothetical protein